jgi:dynein heavy chain
LIKSIDVNEGNRKGNVEVWMSDLEKAMFETMKQITRRSFTQYSQLDRAQWVLNWPGQVVLAVS